MTMHMHIGHDQHAYVPTRAQLHAQAGRHKLPRSATSSYTIVHMQNLFAMRTFEFRLQLYMLTCSTPWAQPRPAVHCMQLQCTWCTMVRTGARATWIHGARRGA